MSRVITASSYDIKGFFGVPSRRAKKPERVTPRVLHMRGKKNIQSKDESGKGTIKFNSLAVLSFLIVAMGTFYLYQVNDLATKGFEIREMEKHIQELQKNSKQMQIKEVELRSMYNIEKSIQELNLVNPSIISYLEINGPVAMK
jgi:hypothetical protein